MTDNDKTTTGAAAAETTAQAVLGGGCFWCLEAAYEELAGVIRVESGYAGGRNVDPSYQEVCDGDTGHAEVVRITYDPAQISFQDLLVVFFTIHDPTTLNRQGADVGTQYRSVIFCQDDEQRRVAEAMIAELNEAKIWDRPIVTEVAGNARFYRAEDYHQDYYRNNPNQGYCQAVINPKLHKFRQKFAEKLKTR